MVTSAAPASWKGFTVQVQLGDGPWEGPVPFWGRLLCLRPHTCSLTPLVPGAIGTLGKPSLPLDVLSQLLFLCLILSCLLLHKGPAWLSFLRGWGKELGSCPAAAMVLIPELKATWGMNLHQLCARPAPFPSPSLHPVLTLNPSFPQAENRVRATVQRLYLLLFPLCRGPRATSGLSVRWGRWRPRPALEKQ